MGLQREDFKENIMANGQNANDYFNNPFNQYTGDMLEYKPELAYFSSPAGKTFAKAASSSAIDLIPILSPLDRFFLSIII